jgi:hypothetical protein
MATAQKRGFRLPWGGDSHRDDAAPEDAQTSTATDAADGGQDVTAEDLGDGPFGPARGLTAEAARGGSRAAVGRLELAWPDSDRKTVGPLAALGRRAAPATDVATTTDLATPQGTVETDAATALQPDVDVDSAPTETTAAGTDTADAETAVADDVEATESALTTTPTDHVEEPEPEIADEQTRDAPTARPAGAPAPAGTRRDNPLVAGLVRAMRDAARTARDESISALRADAATAGEALKARAAEAAAELRKAADADIAAIKEWSRTELARVRAETEARIAARKDQLTWETEADAQTAEDRLAGLARTVEAFEAEMAEFFEVLLAEEDPARLAGLAEQMPAAPELDDLVATTDAFGEADESTVADDGPEVLDGAAGGSDDATRPLETFDADAAEAAEQEARAGLENQTSLLANGLSDVAAIAAFKGALMTVDGVSAINVSAGDSGQVLFAVTHDAGTDLRDAVLSMAEFEVRVDSDDGAALTLEVRERDA